MQQEKIFILKERERERWRAFGIRQRSNDRLAHASSVQLSKKDGMKGAMMNHSLAHSLDEAARLIWTVTYSMPLRHSTRRRCALVHDDGMENCRGWARERERERERVRESTAQLLM